MKKYTFKTRHALLMSLTSLMLCVSMLFGATFAWFTDSVTSGVNRIISGNLDITFEYAQAPNGTYTDVTSAGDIFVAPTDAKKGLWEPGHTEVAYLKVTNSGTLDLRYKLAVAPYSETSGTNVNDVTFKLSDVLKFVATDPSSDVPTAYTRATAQAAANASAATKLTEYTAETTLLAAGASEYITLVVYFPEDAGNEWNYKTGTPAPEISFAISALATQAESKVDSFDDTYDRNATYPALPENVGATVTGLVSGKTDAQTQEIGTGSVGYNIPANTTFTKNNTALGTDSIVTLDVELTGATSGTVTYDIGFTDETGATVEPDGNVTVALNIGKGLSDVKVTHNTAPMDSSAYSYNDDTGVLTITSDSFSPFAISFKVAEFEASINGTGYATLAQAIVAAKSGETVALQKDVTVGSDYICPTSISNVSLDGSGHTVTVTANRTGWFAETANGVVNVSNLTILVKEGVEDFAPVYMQGYCGQDDLTFKNVNLGKSGTNTTLSFSSNNCGGLVSFPWGDSLTFIDCANYNNIAAEGADTGVGVFVGGYFAQFPMALTMTNCENHGDITAAHAGYLCGNNQNMSGVTATITNCTNTGKFTGFQTAGFTARSSSTVGAALNNTYNYSVIGVENISNSTAEVASYRAQYVSYVRYEKTNGETGTLQLTVAGDTTEEKVAYNYKVYDLASYNNAADTSVQVTADKLTSTDVTGHYKYVIRDSAIIINPVSSDYTVTAKGSDPAKYIVSFDADGKMVSTEIATDPLQ